MLIKLNLCIKLLLLHKVHINKLYTVCTCTCCRKSRTTKTRKSTSSKRRSHCCFWRSNSSRPKGEPPTWGAGQARGGRCSAQLNSCTTWCTTKLECTSGGSRGRSGTKGERTSSAGCQAAK